MELARREQDQVRLRFPDEAPFFDEYRRITLTVVGDLPFTKGPQLDALRASGEPVDEKVLVGFPGGPSPGEVADRLGILVLEALAGPLARGARRAVVALPCNTLAPVSWALERAFEDRGSLEEMLDRAGVAGRGDLLDIAAAASDLALSLPTVPSAVFAAAAERGASAVLPLGTVGIVQTYEDARERTPGAAPVAPLPSADQRAVLDAIQACLGGAPADLDRATGSLRAVVDRARREHGGGLTAVEACTDLRLGVGLDSNVAYARAVVSEIYGEPRVVR